MNYIITDFRNVDVQTLKNEISEGIEFEISFPLSSIGFSNSRIDIIRDYSEVSYCCERIAPLLQVLNSDIVTRDKYYTDFKIKCIAIDVENLTNELLHFSEMLSGELVEYDDLDVISFVSEVSDYEESYNKRIFEFPDLINNYWANLINGAYWEMADEYNESQSKFFNKIYRKYPEQRYGFWKSPLSKKISDTIYFSIENWIIPPNTNLTEALKVYSGLENNLFLEDADQIEYKGLIVIINNSTAVYFNQKE